MKVIVSMCSSSMCDVTRSKEIETNDYPGLMNLSLEDIANLGESLFLSLSNNSKELFDELSTSDDVVVDYYDTPSDIYDVKDIYIEECSREEVTDKK